MMMRHALHVAENMSALKLVAKWLLLTDQSEFGTETVYLFRPMRELTTFVGAAY